MIEQGEPSWPIRTRHRGDRRGELLWLAVYPAAWIALSLVSSSYWFLPAGLRMGTLLMLPASRWPWMMAVEVAAILGIRLWGDIFVSAPAIVLTTLLPWCIYAVAVRWCGPHTVLELSARSMPRLLLCTMAAAIANGALFALAAGIDDHALPFPVAVFTYALGDCIGVVLVVPLLLIARERVITGRLQAAPLLARGSVIAPVLMVVAAALFPGWEPYALICALVPLVWLALHAGWRAGAVAVTLLSLAVHLMNASVFDSWSGTQQQLLVAVMAGVSLLIGSSSEHLADQGRALGRLVEVLSKRTQDLSDATNRLSWQQEEDRRRLGQELHDQLGQDMTAIATQLRVVERGVQDVDLRNQLNAIERLVSTAHGHLSEAINQLHPLVLDRFGLSRALSAGPIAQMTRAQRIDYRCLIEGDVDHLPANVATAIYRICQEAVTNCVRHGCGGRVHVHLTRSTAVDQADWITLAIEDDAGPLQIDPGRMGFGLQGIQDRANAIGATYHFTPASGAPRHWLYLQLPPATSLPPGAAPESDDRAGMPGRISRP